MSVNLKVAHIKVQKTETVHGSSLDDSELLQQLD